MRITTDAVSRSSLQGLVLPTVLALALAACGGGPNPGSGVNASSELSSRSSSANPPSSAFSSSSDSSSSSESAPDLDLVVAINAGGNRAATYRGVPYEADLYARGGRSNTTEDPISGVTDDALFQSERYGSYRYEVPVFDGTYTVDLHMVEMYHEANGERAFNMTVEGENAATQLDLYSVAGHDGAYNLTVEDVYVDDGYLSIVIEGLVDNGTLSGYALYSAAGGIDPDGATGPGLGEPGNFGLSAGEPKFLGNIWNYRDVDNASRQNQFAELWNQVTLENAAKWDAVEPNRDQMDLSNIRAAYNWAKDHGGFYRHHVFVWGSQEPSWIGGLSQAEQRAEVEEHMRIVCSEFPDIDMIDVVNEPLNAPASYRNALGGSGSTGWDWIVWSFEKAREHCPNSALGLNDYNIVNNNANMNNYMDIVNVLNERGLIDTVGVQFHHFSVKQMSANTTRQALDRLSQPGLPVVIEEFDVEDNQGEQKYRELFPAMWEHPGVAGVTIWGQRKNETWRQQHRMGVLNSDGSDAAEMRFLREYFNNR